MSAPITHEQAKQLATEHLRSNCSDSVAIHAIRERGVWVVSYGNPDRPDEVLDGGGLVVTDDGGVHNLSSAPGALDDLLMSLDLVRSPVDAAFEREGESLELLADIDPEEAAGLAAWAASRRPWPGVLDEEMNQPYFDDLLRFVVAERRKHEVYPPHGDMFEAFRLTPYQEVRVVILGQDPYPNPGQAMGLAFSVPTNVRPLPTSLVNIHKAMRQDGFIPPDHGDLTDWATQGVLLLNTALTVPKNDAGGHTKQWKPFTDEVIRIVSDRDGPPIVFVLWGAEAQKKKRLIDSTRHALIEAPHPAARRDAQVRFRESQTFSTANRKLLEFGGTPIEWSIR